MSQFGDPNGCFAHLFPQVFELVFDQGRRGFFDDLLVAALNGAIAFAQVNDIAAIVSENLELDVMRVLDELLDVDAGVAKGFLRLRARGVITLHQTDIVVSDPHPAAATACDRFDHDRITDSLGRRQSVLFVFDQAIGTGRNWHAGLSGQIRG